ncbi:MAG: NAD(P)H-binding protein [Rhodanobacter sp.]
MPAWLSCKPPQDEEDVHPPALREIYVHNGASFATALRAAVMKKALLFGATGFIGSQLLSMLLASQDYDGVTIVVRRDPGVAHTKLVTLVGELDSLATLVDRIEADDVFIALGTTKAKTPDEAAYYRIDHDYPVAAAAVAQARGATGVFLVSVVGANAGSSVFYLRTKGEVERDVMALGIPRTHFFRPSQLLGQREEKRPLEGLIIALWPAIDWLLVGGARKYRGIAGAEVARAMVSSATGSSTGTYVHEWTDMKALASR